MSATTTSPEDAIAQPAGNAIPVAVIGCGRMGRLHARVYSQMPQVKLIGVVDINRETALQTAEQYGGQAVASPHDLVGKVRAVSIATPTTTHLEVASPLLKAGIACLIEKPLAPNVAEARRLVDLGRQHKATLQVGHIERFNPAVRSLHKLDIRPRFIEVMRLSPLTFRSIDVGVVLDVMIHDIDIVLSLARSKVARIDAQGVSIIGGGAPASPAEDICSARLAFENGCVANLTASRLSLKTERRLRVFSPEAYVSLDYQKRYGIVVRKTGNLEAIREAVSRIRTGEVKDLSALDYTKIVKVEELIIDDVEPLRAQNDAFIRCVNSGDPPIVSGEDGLAAVELAEAIVAAIPALPVE